VYRLRMAGVESNDSIIKLEISEGMLMVYIGKLQCFY